VADVLETVEQHVYSVTELTRYVKALLEDHFASVYVEGEISNLSAPSSGHLYFTLKDADSQIRCAFFRHMNQRLRFELKDGLQVVCRGRISVYEKRGDYQLYVESVEPKGLGALQLAFQQLRARLEKEGLFDPARKRPIPTLPERIGVVTSSTGAAIRDILNILRRRFANVHVVINPVRVQGDGAAEEIAAAIDDFNRWKQVDVLIVGRGGGSLEDLWAFNEETVARAIHRSKIPVISAVGHEIDWTIADFVADLRAPTPSAAAELVIAQKADLQQQIEGLRLRLAVAVRGELEQAAQTLQDLLHRFRLQHPREVLEQQAQRLDDLVRQATTATRHRLELAREQLTARMDRLEALSPLAVLARGYSLTLTQSDKVVVRQPGQVKRGDLLETKLRQGYIISRVEYTEAS